MAALRSCYFCGEAVGASVDEHAVPADASPDDQVSVTLCSTCKGKLDQLVAHMRGTPDAGVDADRTSEAADGSASGGAQDARQSGTATESAAAPAATDAVDEAEPSESATPESTSAAAESAPAASDSSTAAGEPPNADDPSTAARGPSTPTDPAEAPVSGSVPDDQDPIFATDDGSLLGTEEGAADANADGESADASATGTDSNAAGPDANATGAGADATEASADATDADSGTGTDSATGTDGAAAGTDADDPLDGVSTRTYNRVVRLLQNREFPVDRAEFETLATNAYEMEPGECDDALDAILEKGLLEERGGELHRPN